MSVMTEVGLTTSELMYEVQALYESGHRQPQDKTVQRWSGLIIDQLVGLSADYPKKSRHDIWVMALKARGNLRLLKPESRTWPQATTYVDSLINDVIRRASEPEPVVLPARRQPKCRRPGRRRSRQNVA